MSSTSESKTGSRSVLAAVLGGVSAGALDISYAAGRSALNGRSALGVLQSVGSGLIGSAAFEGGILTAVFGLVCHFFITLTGSAVFLLAYRRVAFLREHFWLGAAAFGVLFYAFMHGLVVPLSAIPFKFTYSPSTVAQGLAVHVLLVGLPIAFCVRKFSSRPVTDA